MNAVSLSVPADAYDWVYFLTDAEGKEAYARSRGRELTPRLQRAIELADLRPGLRVLDVGFGRGETLLHAALRGCSVVGVDYSEDAHRLASLTLLGASEEVRSRVVLLRQEIQSLELEAGSFDRVLLLDIVEHLGAGELARLLRQVQSSLTDDGVCVIHTMPNRLFWDVGYRYYGRWVEAAWQLLSSGRWHLPKEGRNAYSLRVHVNEQTLWSLRRLLRQSGFSARVWLEEDFFRWGQPSLVGFRAAVREAVTRLWPVSLLWPLRFVFNHSLYALCRKA